MTGDATARISAETAALSEYLSAAQAVPLPGAVVRKTTLHVLDTIAAIVSGSAMPAGAAGQAYGEASGCAGPALAIATRMRLDPQTAALVNGMAAHADETDDSHAPSLSHPGCAVVPAALALGEQRGMTGTALLRAVAAGYDVGTRIGMAVGHPHSPLEGSAVSSHAHVGCYAAAAASASLLGFGPERCRAVLSFAAQSVAGTTTWARDPFHVEKAFVFAGMPAANGVRAAQIVDAGWLGVPDPFTSQPNAIDAFSERPDRSQLAAALGERFEIMRTNIKKFAVGSPSQAPVQAALDLISGGDIDVGDISDVIVTMPHDLAPVVDAREMPNINVQHLVSGTLLDGRFTFAMAHDEARLRDGETAALARRVRLVPDPSVTGRREATVELVLRDGRRRAAFVGAVRGTADNPMSEEEVVEKAADLIAPVLGDRSAARIAEAVLGLDDEPSLARLLGLLEARRNDGATA